jgi:hypothetical protein
MIVKVQKSLYDSRGEKRILIYNEDQSVYFTGPWERRHDKLLKRREVKAYFLAKMIRGQIRIDTRIEEQDW